MAAVEISAVLITYNEEHRLEGALRSLAGVASEIIVVDCHSTDGTVRLARRYTDRVFERAWTNFADQKNYANEKAVHPWILSLDADERLSPELRAELLELRKSEPDSRRLLHASPRFLPGTVDPSFGLVPGPEGPALPEIRGALGGRVRP